MTVEHLITKKHILRVAKQEFLEKGFREASLRNIVKDAGVTTGAFYGYYDSKEDLFDDLVRDKVSVFMEKFNMELKSFNELPAKEQPKIMYKTSLDYMLWMIDYIYDNFDIFKLILCCAEGTKYENFMHDLVKIEEKSVEKFISVLKKEGYDVHYIDKQLTHILISGMFSAFFEIVVHDMARKKAVVYVKELWNFHNAGWRKLFGIK